MHTVRILFHTKRRERKKSTIKFENVHTFAVLDELHLTFIIFIASPAAAFNGSENYFLFFAPTDVMVVKVYLRVRGRNWKT